MNEAQADLETRLARYYRSLTPDDSLAASSRASRSIEAARRSSRVSGATRVAFRLPGWGIAAAIAVAAILVAQLLGVSSGPATATPTPTAASLSPSSTGAAVTAAGPIRSGGLWAIKDGLLLTTEDYVTWRGRPMPPGDLSSGADLPPVVALDASHIWLVHAASIEAINGQGPFRVTIERTSDGGASWEASDLPGVYELPVGLLFTDAEHGYVLATPASSAAPAVFRTDDGGTSWSEVSTGAVTASGPVGIRISASDPTTIWAAPARSNTSTSQPELAVSRDAGATWTEVALPDAAIGYLGAGRTPPPARATFFDASHGVFAVQEPTPGSAGPETLKVYATEDGGRTWRRAGSHQAWMMPGVSFSATSPRDWLIVDGWDLSSTNDAGRHWTETRLSGVPEPHPLWMSGFADGLHGFGCTAIGLLDGYPLYLTSDGGRTWTGASFGEALAVPSAPPAEDEAAVRRIVEEFEVARSKGVWESAWGALSPWSQRQFGTVEAFAAWQETLNARGWWQYEITGVARPPKSFSPYEAAMAADLAMTADTNRAYQVVVFHAQLNGVRPPPGSNEDPAKESFVVAPEKGGGWKIWLRRTVPFPAPGSSSQ